MTQNYTSNDTEPPPPDGQLTVSTHQPPPRDHARRSENRNPQSLLQSIDSLFDEVDELQRDKPTRISDGIAHWLIAQYAFAAKEEAANVRGGPMDLKTLRSISAPVAALRGGDHSAAWVAVWENRLKFDERRDIRNVTNTIETFMKWSENEKVKATLESDASYAEKIEMLATELFGEGWRG
ncbi:MAG: hypothetical protein WCD79_17135 [Chthoniobacteraceae bacterium]